MAAPVELLSRVPLLERVARAELAELATRCQERLFTSGSPVTTAGSRGAGFFIIAEGEATVRVHGRVRGRLRRGDCFGELALIDGGRRTADITADTDMRCYGLSQIQFRRFVTEHPEVAWALLEKVVGMLRETQADREPRQASSRRLGLRR